MNVIKAYRKFWETEQRIFTQEFKVRLGYMRGNSIKKKKFNNIQTLLKVFFFYAYNDFKTLLQIIIFQRLQIILINKEP